MTTDFNKFPYYDDFDKNKNFYKILFRPGYSVQARELTQLQTSLQNQIENFGSHIFKNGSVVLGGNSHYTKCNYFDPVDQNGQKLSSSIAKAIEGKTITAPNGFSGEVFYVNEVTSRIYFVNKTGVSIQKNQIVSTTGTLSISVYTKDEDLFLGSATRYAIEESVYFVNGNFVHSAEQSIIIGEDNPLFSCYVGFQITNKVVTSQEDETLLDPAQGSFNFAAPGADREAVYLTLSAINYASLDVNKHLLLTDSFIETSRFEDGQLVEKTVNSDYSNLESNLARRTYDESGDYTTVPFKTSVATNIFTADDSKLTLVINPGKAYVKGYEFETIAPVRINFDKARDIRRFSDYPLNMNIGGTLFYVSGISGNIDFTTKNSVNFLDSLNSVMGIGSVRHIEYVSSVNNSNVYALYIEDINLYAGSLIKDIRKFSNNVFNANVELSLYSGEVTASTAYPNNLVSFNTKFIQTFINESSMYDVNFFYDKKLTTTLLLSGGVASASLNSSSASEFFIGSGLLSIDQVNSNYYTVVSSSSDINFPVGKVLSYQDGFRINVNSNQTSFTASLPATSNIGVILYAKVSVSQIEPKQKVLTEATQTFGPQEILQDTIILNQADGYSLNSIILYKDSAEFDVTSRYEFDGGQKDSFYDLASIKLKGSLPVADYTSLVVSYNYFEHSGDGFFNVDSYTGSGVSYTSIPKYKSKSTGEVFELRDSVDFRPRKLANGSFANNIKLAIPQSIFTSDFSHYLPRIDKLVLTKERKFDVIKGISNERPVPPTDLPDAMTLYILNLDAYTTDPKSVSLSYVDNRRYTMRDIARIDKRVERVEYYTTLSLLEKQAADEQYPSNVPGIDRFKNGILVDSFAGHSIGDITNGDYSCSIDYENRILRPRFDTKSFNFKISSTSGVSVNDGLVTLSYTEEPLINQPFASRTVNLNPYSVYNWNGVLTMSPSSDTWIDTTQKPDVVINLNGENDIFTNLTDSVTNAVSGVKWNDWQTVIKGTPITNSVSSSASTTDKIESNSRILESTTKTTTTTTTSTTADSVARVGLQISTGSVNTVVTDLGNKVVDFSIAPFIRSREVDFFATGMKPNTVYFASFDGYEVSNYCTIADELRVDVVNKNGNEIRSQDGLKTAKVVGSRTSRVYVRPITGVFNIGDSILWFKDGIQLSSNLSVILDKDNLSILQTNDIGDIAGVFKIPDQSVIKFRAGEKIFRIADSLIKTNATSAAEFKYVASGFSQSTEKNSIATRIQQVSINPLLGFDTITKTSTNVDVSSSTSVVDITPPPPLPPEPIQTFSLYAKSSTVYEGDVAEFILDTTNVPDGTNLSYVISGISQTDIGIPLSGNVQVKNNTSTILVPIKNDTLNEQIEVLTISLTTKNGIIQAQVSIINVETAPTYQLNASNGVLFEGQSARFTFMTANIDPGTQFNYTVTGSVSSNDLVNFPLSGVLTVQEISSGELTPEGGKYCEAILDFVVASDALVENQENLLFSVSTPSGVVSKEILVRDVPPVPSYTLNSNKSTIREGESVTFTLDTFGVSNGTVFNYAIRGITTADITTPLTGTLTVNSNTASVSITTVEDAVFENAEDMFFDVLISSTNVITTQVRINNYATPAVQPVQTFNLTKSAGSVGEGQPVTFTLATTNVTNGTLIPYTIYGDIDASDISVPLTGNFTVNSNTASIVITPISDAFSENAEQLFIKAITPIGDLVSSVEIVDTPHPIVFTLTKNKGVIIEGDTVAFTLTASGVILPDGTSFPYRITGITSSDITTPLSGNITLVGNGGTVVLTTIADNLTEGNETLTFTVDSVYSGITYTQSESVIIQDFVLTPEVDLISDKSEVFEEDVVTFTINTINVPTNTQIFYSISTNTLNAATPVLFKIGTGNSTSFQLNNTIYTNTRSGFIASTGDSTNVVVQIQNNSLYDASNVQNLFFTVQGLGSPTNSAQGTGIVKQVSIKDRAPVPTLTILANNKTPVRNQEIVYTVTTTNVQSGTEVQMTVDLLQTVFDFKQQVEYIEYVSNNVLTRLNPNGILTVNGRNYSRLAEDGTTRFIDTLTINNNTAQIKVKTKYDLSDPDNLFPDTLIRASVLFNNNQYNEICNIVSPEQPVVFSLRSDRTDYSEGETLTLTATASNTYAGQPVTLTVFNANESVSTDFGVTFPIPVTFVNGTAVIQLVATSDGIVEGQEGKIARLASTASPALAISTAATSVQFAIVDAVVTSAECLTPGNTTRFSLLTTEALTEQLRAQGMSDSQIFTTILAANTDINSVVPNTNYTFTYPTFAIPIVTLSIPFVGTASEQIYTIPGSVGGTVGGLQVIVDSFTYSNSIFNANKGIAVIESLTVIIRANTAEIRANIRVTSNDIRFTPVQITNTSIVLRYRHIARVSSQFFTRTCSAGILQCNTFFNALETGADPVAQTFYVNSSRYPNGLFLNSVDLYFAKKTDSESVFLQIRPVENGFPSAVKTLPFAVLEKEGTDITISADASAATNFKFNAPVYLAPGEYSFVVVARSTAFEIYSATIGDFLIDAPDTRITEQPFIGSMFKSQNGSTWTPIQEEDVKFKLNFCSFDTSNTGSATLDIINDVKSDVFYDVFYMGGEILDFANTNIDSFYNTRDVNGVITTLTPYQYESNSLQDSRKVIRATNDSDLQARFNLSTRDKYISPVLDMSRLSTVLVSNIINTDSSGENEVAGGNAVAKYLTKTVKLNAGFEADDIRVTFNAKRPSGSNIKVYYKAATIYDQDMSTKSWIEMDLEYGVPEEGKFVEYRYKTSNDTAIGDNFSSFSIKIVMLSDNTTKVPEITDLRVVALDA